MKLPVSPERFPFGSAPEFLARLEYHLSTPEIDVNLYRAVVRRRQANRALASHRLYLDTNHWTHLRDAALGRPRDSKYTALLRQLEWLVASGSLVVVFSDHLVDEVCHQADLDSRRATAEVIDRLTAGVTLIGFHDRSFIEIRRWVRAVRGECSPIPLDEVWTTPPHVYKVLDFELSHPDKKLVAAFLKAVEDLADRLGFRAIVDRFGLDTRAVEGSRHLAKELTLLKTTTWRDQGPFAEVFREEALSYFDKVLFKVEPEMLEYIRRLPLSEGLEGEWLIANAKRAFVAAEDLAILPESLPSLRAIAGGNSRIRTESGRKFKPGDGADLFHAAAALAYCHIFLTDRSMQHLWTTPPTDFASVYGCTVISSVDEAITHISRLAT